MALQQPLIGAPNLDSLEESGAWESLQAGRGSPAPPRCEPTLRLAVQRKRGILNEVALNLSDLHVCVCIGVCVCHVPLHPCQAPEGRLSKGPCDATHSRAQCSAALGRAGAPSCREGGMMLEAGKG